MLHIKQGTHRSLTGAIEQNRPRFEKTPSVPGEHVWCVENDVGTLIIRRHGKVAVVGNCLGRMIRIGSPHPAVVAYHLMAERPNEDRKTIDHHVLKLLRKKKGLIDKVLGESAVGALKFEKEEKGGVMNLLRAMQGRSK